MQFFLKISTSEKGRKKRMEESYDTIIIIIIRFYSQQFFNILMRNFLDIHLVIKISDRKSRRFHLHKTKSLDQFSLALLLFLFNLKIFCHLLFTYFIAYYCLLHSYLLNYFQTICNIFTLIFIFCSDLKMTLERSKHCDFLSLILQNFSTLDI